MVSQSRINKHLDRCLNGNPECARALTSTTLLKNKKPPAPMLQLKPKRGSSTLARPTKLAYSLLSESKLRRTLKELGIPFKGEKSQMQARHVEWVNMYMANADSETPVSHHILLKRLSAWEESMLRQSEAPRNDTHSQQPRHQRNSLQNLDTSTADHVVKYADSFA
ncbi:E3 ubiquitin-protein ligase rad18, partial [Coemansia sp. RSA 2049]